MISTRLTPGTVATFALTLALGGALHAGTISIAWDPVVHEDLAGYRVYYGTVPGSLGQSLDAGTSTAATLSGLADCTSYQVAVKAYDGEGVESATFSNSVTGWARPLVTAVAPSSVEQQSQATLTIDGVNFMQGVVVSFDDPALSVTSLGWVSCQRLVVQVVVGAAAELGAVGVRVVNPDGVFGDAAGFLSVGVDDTAPTLGSIAATGVAATTATVGWTTNEPAGGRVFFRRPGQSAWQQTGPQSGLSTQHSMTLEGLWPQTSYQYYVESADAAGNTASSTPASFLTSANAHRYLRFEAESGAILGPIAAGTGTGAFANSWIGVAAGTPTGVITDPAGTSTHGFWIPQDGTWYVWVRIFGASTASDSWFERVDGGVFAPFTSPAVGEWRWVEVRNYVLATGQHTFTLGGREASARADRVLVTDDAAFVPTELPGDDVTPPLGVSGLTAVPTSGQVALSWTVPANSGASRMIVRYRTDGVAPTSPIDGRSVLDTAVPAAGPSGTLHSGLPNGTAHRYSVFLVDAAGNVSPAASIAATPAGVPPPAVGNLHRTDVN